MQTRPDETCKKITGFSDHFWKGILWSKAIQEFLKVKKWNILQWPSQCPDFNPIEHLVKTKLKAERPIDKQLESAAVKACQSITNGGNYGPHLKVCVRLNLRQCSYL